MTHLLTKPYEHQNPLSDDRGWEWLVMKLINIGTWTTGEASLLPELAARVPFSVLRRQSPGAVPVWEPGSAVHQPALGPAGRLEWAVAHRAPVGLAARLE